MELFIYLLKVSVCTVLFFGVYLVVLRKLTFFKINRFYLIVALFLSFVIPAIQINIEKEAEIIQAQVPMVLAKVQNTGNLETNRTEILPMSVTEAPFDWLSIITYIYFTVTTVLLLVSIWQLLRLIRFTRGFSKPYQGLKLISKKKDFTNCSFFNYVFIDETGLSEADLLIILHHEQVHADQYHSIDKIVLMVAKAILWFNPIIYLFDKALEQTHEYEADEVASHSLGNNAYASLLLRLAIGKSDMPFTHNFVKSPIKNRIKMLFSSKSNNMKRFAYFFALPVGLGLVWLFSVQMVYIDSRVKDKLSFKAEQPSAKKDEIKGKEEFKINTKIKKGGAQSLEKRDTVKLNQAILPKIISSTKITGDLKKKISYLENAVIEILGSTIKAKYVELNQKEKVLIADHAVIANGGNMIIADKAVFNLLNGTYRVYESNSELEKKASFTDFSLKENENMIAKSIHYSALDSIKLTKDKLIISLYGSEKMYFKDMRMEADEISFNSKTLIGSAKNLVITQVGSATKIKGANAKFNLNGKVEIWQSSGENLIVEQ